MGRRRGRRRGAEGEAGHGKPWRAAVPWSCGPGELGGLDSLAEAAAGSPGGAGTKQQERRRGRKVAGDGPRHGVVGAAHGRQGRRRRLAWRATLGSGASSRATAGGRGRRRRRGGVAMDDGEEGDVGTRRSSLSLRRRNEGGGDRALHGNEEEEEMDRGRDAGGSWDPLPGDVRVWWRRWQGTRGEMGCVGAGLGLEGHRLGLGPA